MREIPSSRPAAAHTQVSGASTFTGQLRLRIQPSLHVPGARGVIGGLRAVVDVRVDYLPRRIASAGVIVRPGLCCERREENADGTDAEQVEALAVGTSPRLPAHVRSVGAVSVVFAATVCGSLPLGRRRSTTRPPAGCGAVVGELDGQGALIIRGGRGIGRVISPALAATGAPPASDAGFTAASSASGCAYQTKVGAT